MARPTYTPPPAGGAPAIGDPDFPTKADAYLGWFSTHGTFSDALATWMQTEFYAAVADGTAAAPTIRSAGDTNTGWFFPGADIMAASAGGSERVRVTTGGFQVTGLLTGTAVTQSITDTTPGRLMKVGDFGLGAAGSPGLPGNALADNLPSGFYTTDGATTGLGSEAGANGALLRVQRGAGAANPGGFDLWRRGSGQGALKYRDYSAGAASAWSWIYRQADILGPVAQLSGVPTGAIIERGSNSNGSYVRFADGTQICRHELSPGLPIATADGAIFTSANYSWTFPAAFVARPYCDGSLVAGLTSAWVTLGDFAPTAASGSFRMKRATTTAETAWIAGAIAIGRWF